MVDAENEYDKQFFYSFANQNTILKTDEPDGIELGKLEMKRKVILFGILLGAMMVCSSCSKARECNCRLTWTNPNYSVAASEYLTWPVNAGEPCSKAAEALSEPGYYTYTCSEQ